MLERVGKVSRLRSVLGPAPEVLSEVWCGGVVRYGRREDEGIVERVERVVVDRRCSTT